MSELDDLTRRVGDLLTSGRLPREIAKILRLSERDVKKLIERWNQQQERRT